MTWHVTDGTIPARVIQRPGSYPQWIPTCGQPARSTSPMPQFDVTGRLPTETRIRRRWDTQQQEGVPRAGSSGTTALFTAAALATSLRRGRGSAPPSRQGCAGSRA